MSMINKKHLTSLLFIAVLSIFFQGACAQKGIIENWQYNPDKELNPNTQWLREAKWGLFIHYIGGSSGEDWNKRVNAFDVEKLTGQLTELKVPYFFITIGRQYFCAPNENYERLFGPGNGKLSDRDLVAELAKELNSRGIRLCLYISAVGRNESKERQAMWREVITEWSERYGESIHAWWVDGAAYDSPEVFKAYTAAFKSGNPKVLVSYNSGPVGTSREQLLPVTEYEDYLAGEVDFILPTCGVRIFDGKEYYLGPNISGDQLHFLNFLGAWWGGRTTGEPRFSDELVISWTQHIIDFKGAVTWDLPVSYEGNIPEAYFNQVKALSKAINNKK
jgi:hypothetical protein